MTTNVPTASKGIAKLFGALALASGAALPSCATDVPESVPEPTGTSKDALVCGTTTCPTDSGTCGSWTCGSLGKICTFKAALQEGSKCATASKAAGICIQVGGGRTLEPEHLMCCPGCWTGSSQLGTITCHAGDSVGYCGEGGIKCDACNSCETCSANKCVGTSGNSCGTCQVCSAGTCGAQPVGTNCSGGHCADGNTCCTGDACVTSGGSCVASDDAHCGSDGNACTACGECETCSNGACQPLNSGSCDDGNPCTENDTCSSGTCGGTPVETDDGNECTDDDCTEAAGPTHVSVAEGTPCSDDGSNCTSGERCTDADNDDATARVCLPATGRTCFDDNPCTSDAVDCGNDSCPYDPVPNGDPCSTNNRCILGESCQAGECTGEARNCNDDNPCTTDSCEPDVNDPDADPATGCKHVPRTATCDDGNPCTEDDACSAGTCEGTPVACTALDECHGVGTCDPGTGECTDPRLQDGTGCENTGTCEGGKCVGGTPTATGGSGGMGGSGGGSGGSSGGTGGSGTNAGEGGEAGDGTAATSGEGPTTGGSAGRGSGGRGGTGSGATGGTGGKFTGKTYARDPGGCSCETTGKPAAPGSALGLFLAGAAAFFTRKRRRAA